MILICTTKKLQNSISGCAQGHLYGKLLSIREIGFDENEGAGNFDDKSTLYV
jgi:hypothetical protein